MLDPFRSMDPFRMMREMMGADPFSGTAPVVAGAFAPDIEVKETKSAYVIRVDLPGVKAGDLDVSVTGSRLAISARREEEERAEDDRYYAYERSYGSFSRAFVMPDGADMENIKADLKEGVLSIEVPKKAEMHPRRVEIGQKATETEREATPAAAEAGRPVGEPKKAA